jgi:multiple sugar transport system substrate-binding protein
MKRNSLKIAAISSALILAASMAACSSNSPPAGGNAGTTGPIEIWYSNNKAEVTWGKAMVAEWNAAHADQQITAQEIPAGKSSEEVINAAITAGTAPCLIFNTAPVAVAQFQKAGGLVALDTFKDGAAYIQARTGALADQYKSSDGKFYQLPWKSNPVVLFYNKDIFKKAGVDPSQLDTQADLLAAARKIKQSGAAQFAMWPSPGSEFYQSWFDFYPFYAAASNGTPLIKDGKSTFNSDAGKQTAEFWKTMYAEGLASKEVYQGDSFADGKAAIAVSGPWAIDYYGDKVNWGTVPVPGLTASDKSYTFSDAKNIGLFSACKNQQTAWDVLKFATSPDQDGKFLKTTGQMPMRSTAVTDYADFFTSKPAYKAFSDQATRTVEVPNVNNAVEVWQTFRDAYSKTVVSGQGTVDDMLKSTADKIDQLVAAK